MVDVFDSPETCAQNDTVDPIDGISKSSPITYNLKFISYLKLRQNFIFLF